jgi:hypothetical protein
MPGSSPLPAPHAEAIEREVRLQRLLMVYIVVGLMFMLLLGTFLGVWNLITNFSLWTTSVTLRWIAGVGCALRVGSEIPAYEGYSQAV